MIESVAHVSATRPPPHEKAAGAAEFSAQNQAQHSATKSDKSDAISPQIKADPVAGVIVQFLDKNGDIQSQIPSHAALAYLKAGLSADGTRKEDDAASASGHHEQTLTA